MGWLVYETQHLLIYIHLQAMRVAYPTNFISKQKKPCSNIGRTACDRGVIVNKCLSPEGAQLANVTFVVI